MVKTDAATIELMTEEEAVDAVKELLSIAHELTRLFYRENPYQLRD